MLLSSEYRVSWLPRSTQSAMLVRKYVGSSSSDEESIDLRACIDLRALICGGSAVICGPGPEMDRSLKRSISSLDLAPDAGAAQARRSAQPSNQDYLKVFLDPPPPPSRPLPQIDGSTLQNLELLIQYTNLKRAAEEYGRNVDTFVQLVADRKAPEQELEEFEAPEEEPLPPAKGRKKYDTTGEKAGCTLYLELDHARALAAKGLPDDGSNRSESFLDARCAAYWKADQLGRQEQDQDAAEQAETSKQGQQALKDRGPDARPNPCPRHRRAGREAGEHQYRSKPFHCGCCVGTCELCDPSLSGRSQRSPSCSPTTDSDLALGADPFGDGAPSEDLPQLEESQPNPQGG